MTQDNMITLICTFGGYIFKPVSPKTLLENKVFPDDTVTSQFDKDDDSPVYILGVACNRMYVPLMPESERPSKLRALDDLRIAPGYTAIEPISMVSVYGNGQYGRMADRDGKMFQSSTGIWSTTKVIENLIQVAGIQSSFPKNTHEKEFYDALNRASYTEPTVKKSSQVTLPTEEEPSGKIVLSREEIIDMLKAERERAGSRRLVAMYDSVIRMYGTLLKQNKKGKLVRMADGSRKWFPNDKAAEYLKLPRDRRV